MDVCKWNLSSVLLLAVSISRISCAADRHLPKKLPGYSLQLVEGEAKNVSVNCTGGFMNDTHSKKIKIDLIDESNDAGQGKKLLLMLSYCWDPTHQNDTVRSSHSDKLNVSYSQQQLTITGLKVGSYTLEAVYTGGLRTEHHMPIKVVVFPKDSRFCLANSSKTETRFEESSMTFKWHYKVLPGEFDGIECTYWSRDQPHRPHAILSVSSKGIITPHKFFNSSRHVVWAGNLNHSTIALSISALRKSDDGQYACSIAFGDQIQLKCDVINLHVEPSCPRTEVKKKPPTVVKANYGATVNLAWLLCLDERDRDIFSHIELVRYSNETFELMFKIDNMGAAVAPSYRGLLSLSSFRNLESYEFILHNANTSSQGSYAICLITTKRVILSNFSIVIHIEENRGGAMGIGCPQWMWILLIVLPILVAVLSILLFALYRWCRRVVRACYQFCIAARPHGQLRGDSIELRQRPQSKRSDSKSR